MADSDSIPDEEGILAKHTELLSDHAGRIAVLETHVQDLRHWREVLSEKLDQRFERLDEKLDTVMQGQEQIRTEVVDRINNAIKDLKLALPPWAQIAIYILLGLLGLTVGWVLH